MCDISLNFYPTKKLGMTFANLQGYKVKRNHTLGFQEELENEKYKKKGIMAFTICPCPFYL